MRPLFGVVLELVALFSVLLAGSALAGWYPLSILVLLLAQVLTTVLVHCPAHYFVGRALGIRFSRMRLGHTTISRALPPSLRRIGSLLIVFTLSLDRESKKHSSPRRLRAMFLAGVTASVGSAVTFAYAVSLTGNLVTGVVSWAFAIVYLASDVLLSPKAGDMMRARRAASRYYQSLN